jgi:hypothetical protein
MLAPWWQLQGLGQSRNQLPLQSLNGGGVLDHLRRPMGTPENPIQRAADPSDQRRRGGATAAPRGGFQLLQLLGRKGPRLNESHSASEKSP